MNSDRDDLYHKVDGRLLCSWKLGMAYEVSFMEIAGAQGNSGPKACMIYRFEIFDGPERTRADAVLTEAESRLEHR